jgi:hypothetical protein
MVAGMEGREERVARNESISREINEGLEQAHAESPQGSYPHFVCECGNESCNRLVTMSLSEYEQIRSDPRQFAVVQEHVMPDVEDVISETDRFVIVAKKEGTPAEVAEAEDPRS